MLMRNSVDLIKVSRLDLFIYFLNLIIHRILVYLRSSMCFWNNYILVIQYYCNLSSY